jgi:hypothetical protein
MRLRRFTSDGLQAFREFLALCRRQPDTEVSLGMLENKNLTQLVTPECQVAPNYFETKGEAAQYLHAALKPISVDKVSKDAGLWSWLSLLFLDSICPVVDGQRIVKNDYYYLFEPLNTRHYYRHLLYISWRVLHLAPTYNRLFLTTPASVLDAMTTEVMKRLYLTRVPCIFEVLDRLYWDEQKRKPRSGLTRPVTRLGDLTHRLPIRIRQQEKTYDLMSLTADQLLDLLGKEFAFARPKSRRLFSENMVPTS